MKKIRLLGGLGLAIGGAAYFAAYSNLDTHFLTSAGLVIVPVQVGACVYLLYLFWTGRLRGTSRYQKQRQEHEP
jgi:hypothetical protein